MKQGNSFKIIIGALIVLGVIFLMVSIGQNNQGGTSATDSSDLNANVSTNAEGVTVVNNESSSWLGCEVGVNGGCGWDFQDPPYQTHEQYTITGGESLTVPYGSMSDTDGEIFDPTTHVVNSVVVMCSMGTNDEIERSFCGAH